MDILAQDLRYAVRTLMRSPAFALIAALCLALGIGVNTAIFSLVRGVLFRPLPFANADRLTAVWATDERRGVDEAYITYADLHELRTSGVFEQVEGFAGRNVTLTAGDQAERIEAGSITPGLFQMIGVRPQSGRWFRADEGAPAGQEQVVLLSDALWRTRFGADPGILNQAIPINGRLLTVVGIMPPSFMFPETEKLWLPLGMADATNRQARFIWALGSLRRDLTLQTAGVRLSEIAARW
ncbi:MAG TPA: ABC transporter permease, partial [Longimicrobiales bacterium]|nr:ABC transporter permease [Longimicrobiales bacterium]